MNAYKINSNYAKALFLLAQDLGQVEECYHDMLVVRDVCAENRDFCVVMGNPVIRSDRKVAIVTEIFRGHVSDATMAFLVFVTRKNRAVNLHGIASFFDELYCQHNNIVKAKMLTACEVDDDNLARVRQVIANFTHKTVQLDAQTTDKMLGSFYLVFDNYLYDARLRTKIAKLRAEFSKNDYESKL